MKMEEKLPSTILHPAAFRRALPANGDGVFDWGFLTGASPRGIMPTDIDGEIEQQGQFITYETKGPGVPIPIGQWRMLKAKRDLGVFTIILLWGKGAPLSGLHLPVRWQWMHKFHEIEIPHEGTYADVRRFHKAWSDAVEAHIFGSELARLLRGASRRGVAWVQGMPQHAEQMWLDL